MARFHFFRRFILSPGFVGLACCACQPISTIAEGGFPQGVERAEELADSPAHQAADPTSPGQPVSTTVLADAKKAIAIETDAVASVQSSLTAYQTGLELASSAHMLSQSAISPDDWGLVSSRWSRAADQLKQVTANSEHYQTAQQKIAEYRQNAVQIQTKVKRLQNEVYVPLAPLPAAAPATAPATAPVTLEKLTPQSDRPSSNTGRRLVQVPIVRRLHGTPVVQVTFNGTHTYDMILDTGASRTLVTRQMANDLEIVITERMIAATASAAEVTFDIGQVRTMTVGSRTAGSVTLNNARVSVGDAVGIGLLGNDFFSGYDVIIRSGESVVELVES